MKILIIYFSGTGTTATFGKEIATGFKNNGHIVNLIRFKHQMLNDFDYNIINNYDILGFACPTWAYRAPRIFTQFLKRFPKSNQPFFLFCTCGGQPGNTIWNLYKILKNKGMICLDSAVFASSDNNIRAWRPKMSKPVPNDGVNSSVFQFAQHFSDDILKSYQELIVEKANYVQKIKPNILTSLFTILFTYRWQMSALEFHKIVDLDKCTACGICSKVICPSGAIRLNDVYKPLFKQSECVGCEGCVSLCPQLAIASLLSKKRHPYTIYSKSILNPPK
jgi:ferredoxin/flavodoxin